MKLYTYYRSQASFRVRIAMNLKGLKHEDTYLHLEKGDQFDPGYKAVNPQAVVGQIQGGTAQGLGLAVMEEIQVVDGVIRNPSFTDYLIPTILDMPPMEVDVLERGDPDAPYGLRGVGELPSISSTPAILAALRAATGRAVTRAPALPEDLVVVDQETP